LNISTEIENTIKHIFNENYSELKTDTTIVSTYVSVHFHQRFNIL